MTGTRRDFLVGAWLVEPTAHRLSKGTETVAVEPKVMAVLLCLAEHAGDVVSYAHLLETVWEDTIVHPKVLSRAVSVLRKVFGDSRQAPRYIETISKSGYRLIAPVTDPPDPAEPGTTPARTTRNRRPAWYHTGLAGGILLGIMAGLFAWIPSPPTPTPPMRVTPFTTYPGSESYPAFSPDGQRLAFAWDGPDHNNVDIYVKLAAAETPLQLTDDPAVDLSPAWSPDGQSVAFHRFENGVRSVYVVSALGGPARLVAACTANLATTLSWSPDGQWLVLSDQETPEGPFQLFLFSLTTHRREALTQPDTGQFGDINPVFSPDGQYVAFIRTLHEGIQDVYVIALSNRETRRLTFDDAVVMDLDWAGDDRTLVFASYRDGRNRLWRIPVQGGAPSALPAASDEIHQLTLARTTRHLAYTASRAEVNIWRHSVAPGPEPAAPFIASTRWDANPDVAPDGTHIAFASSRTGAPEIWIQDAMASYPLQLTHFGGPLVAAPRWSPDGQRLLFEARVENHLDLYLIDPEGGLPHRLTENPADETAASWSRDGAWIYFASDRTGTWQVWRMPARGGEATQVTQEGGFAAQESPDGNRLYFTRHGRDGLWHMPAGGGTATRILNGLASYDWGHWAPTGNGIYYLDRTAYPTPTLVRFDVEKNDRTVVMAFSKPVVTNQRALGVSPDGQWILYTQMEHPESDIMLLEGVL